MDESTFIAKIAHMYYAQDMDLKEIGEIFNVSYATISRLLKKGRETGIIKILIDSHFERSILLESELKNAFNLKEVFSVNVGPDYSNDAVLNIIGIETANYLEKKLKDGDKLGISWGRTINNVVNNFHTNRKVNVDLIQLQGQIPGYNFEFSALELVRRLKSMFSGSYHFINTDAIVDSPQMKEMIMEHSSAKDTIALFSSINVALMSVGFFNEDMIVNLFNNFVYPEEREDLEKHNIVGMNLFSFFDINGHIYKSKINSRVISIDTEDLLKVKNKIMVVAGKEKIPAIIGALRAGMVDTLFIDNITLESLLDQLHSQ